MTQRLELVWPGKDKFLLVPKDESGKPVWVDRDHPAAREVRLTDFRQSHGEVSDEDPYSDNLLFTGDSLDVLRVLRDAPECAKQYRGKVKQVYIDPPFNTGQTFSHYDDWMEHSTWLSFMRDRLVLIKDLLSADGSVWVHLDDAEVHRMRCLMDEVYGAENFQATVVWQRVDNAASRASTSIVPSHDYILVYSRSGAFVANQESRTEVPAHYDRIDDAGRHYCSRMLRKSGASSRREDRPSMWFGIAAPDGSEVWPIKSDGSEGRWQWGPDRVLRDHSLLDWQRNSRGGWEPYLRIYFEDDSTTPHQTWWPYGEVGSNRLSKLEIKAVIPSASPFPTPKPERLIERVLHIGSNPGDIVLDCFGGSGTTAAVAHKMGRRWVTAEVLRETIATFIVPRLNKVLEGADDGGVTASTGWLGGGGFREVTVSPSMYEITPLGVMLADWANGERFARAVAGQLGFEWQSEEFAPFCGKRGRMRLCVFDGAVGVEEAREVIAALDERERVTIVAKVLLADVEEFVAEQSKGSRVKKAPRDLLVGSRRRERRRVEGPK